MGRQFGTTWQCANGREARKIPWQVEFVLGLDIFIFFDSLLHSLLFFPFHAEEFWNRGLMWAP